MLNDSSPGAFHEGQGACELALAHARRRVDLERTIDTPCGEFNLGQMLESFVIWHINAHCGEISALKGCQGLKGYPW